MKTKCQSLRLSILIFFISLIIYTIFYFLNTYQENIIFEFVANICLGLFGSSFVVFLISIVEYKIAKVQILEKIWNESRKLNHELYKIRPFYSKVPDDILVDYISESLFNENEVNKQFFKQKDNAYKNIYDYFCEYYGDALKNISTKKKKCYIDSLIKTEKDNSLNNLEKIIDQYLNLYNCSFDELNNLLGDVQFFTGKKQYIELFKQIYDPLKEKYDILKSGLCYDFRLYRNGDANRPDVLLKVLLEMQNELFKFSKKNNEDGEWVIINSSFCDKMEDNIEHFRAKTIYNCEEDKIEHFPIESILNINTIL